MEDKLNNTPDEKEQTEAKPVYTDPNAAAASAMTGRCSDFGPSPFEDAD